MMAKHGLRTWHQRYTRLDGRCRVCNQNFGCAVRLQKHLAGTLRNKKGTGGCLRQLVVRGEIAGQYEQQQTKDHARELAKLRKRQGLSVGYAEQYAVRGDEELGPMVQGPVPRWTELGMGSCGNPGEAASGAPNVVELDPMADERRKRLETVASVVALWCSGGEREDGEDANDEGH
eukprot:TRINITY_DN28347_c0_g1_i2.p1 TRINITY_DN28347_c0_g1~~TRINITY_DN28347_c0_g1_i2.p1  ORF type:complete len:176 (+),score=31.81 TRINITY_DN28347_c0_g1_i2:249-776(+)